MRKLFLKYEIALAELGYALGWLPKKEVAELTIRMKNNRKKNKRRISNANQRCINTER